MRARSLRRAEHKMACLRRIVAGALAENRRLLLVNCVETYLQLSPRESAEFTKLRALRENREVHAMEMTWADRLVAKGWKSGRQEGRRREREKAVRALRPLVLELLGERFGPLPEPVRDQVQVIDSVEQLTRLARLGLAAESLEEMGLG